MPVGAKRIGSVLCYVPLGLRALSTSAWLHQSVVSRLSEQGAQGAHLDEHGEQGAQGAHLDEHGEHSGL